MLIIAWVYKERTPIQVYTRFPSKSVDIMPLWSHRQLRTRLTCLILIDSLNEKTSHANVPLILKFCVPNCPIDSFFSNLYTCLSLYPPVSVEYLISFPNIHSAVHTYLNYPTLHISRYPRGNLALLLVGGEPYFIQWDQALLGYQTDRALYLRKGS